MIVALEEVTVKEVKQHENLLDRVFGRNWERYRTYLSIPIQVNGNDLVKHIDTKCIDFILSSRKLLILLNSKVDNRFPAVVWYLVEYWLILIFNWQIIYIFTITYSELIDVLLDMCAYKGYDVLFYSCLREN